MPRTAVAATVAVMMQTACIVPHYTRWPVTGQLSSSTDGQPIAGAQVHVESWNLAIPHSREGELLGTFDTRTDDLGRWAVPGRLTLLFMLPIPEGPAFGDAYTFQTASGDTLTVKSWQGSQGAQSASGLRATIGESERLETHLLPAVGLIGGDGQGVSVHAGVVLLSTISKIRSGGVRICVAPGVTALSAGGGIVLSPFTGPLLFPALEINARWRRPWRIEPTRAAAYGPEIAVDLLNLRFSVSALADTFSTSLGRRQFFVGVGYGFL